MQIRRLSFLAIAVGAIASVGYFFFVPATTRMDVSLFKLGDGIEFTPGPETRTLYVFEQPHCKFCTKLAPELDKLRNVRVLIFPIAPHEDGSPALVRDAWCSPDRAAAWRIVLAERPIPKFECDTSPAGRNLSLAKAAGLDGTPALVFPNGDVHIGFMAAQNINEQLVSTPQ